MRVLYNGVEYQAKLLGKRDDGTFQVELHDAGGEPFVAQILPENVITEVEPAIEDPEIEVPVEDSKESTDESAEVEEVKEVKEQDDTVVKFSIIVVAAFVLYYY